jgi:hypothetical protein
VETILKADVSQILHKWFAGLPQRGLQCAYSDHKWLLWKFKQPIPAVFWDTEANCRDFLESLGQELGFKTMEDWYNVKADDIRSYSGYGLLLKYNNSVVNVLKSVFAEHDWIVWNFSMVPHQYWDSFKNHVEFFTRLSKKLGFTTLDDWYGISSNQICKNGGVTLLERYKGSPLKALEAVFPNHQWIAWKFHQVPRGYWNRKDNQRKFLDWLTKELQVNKNDDWYRISKKQIRNVAPVTLFRSKTLGAVLSELYPEYSWSIQKFQDGAFKASQRVLATSVQELFSKSSTFNLIVE